MLDRIQKELRNLSREKVVASTRKFVPGSQAVYGVAMPDLNILARKYQEGGFDLVEDLWKSGAFEERMLAGKILNRIAKKDPEKTLKLIERFSKDLSDWAICDCLGTQAIKKILKSQQEEIITLSNKLVASKRMWQRRLALVLLEGYTRDTPLRTRIKAVIKKVEHDDEYYVKKAVQWLNRNFLNSR